MSDYTRRYRCKYEYTQRFGHPHHEWSLLGAKGGLHLHISDYGEKYQKEYGERYQGGIEIHHRTPPGYMRNDPPSQDECWLLHAPCWHDGSSLQASERWIPLWLINQHDHDHMFAMLAVDADYHFGYSEAEAAGGAE